MVGSSISRNLRNSPIISSVIESSRKDTNLFSFPDTQNKIDDVKPDIVINAAAKVGGINANNVMRTQFILDNLKINMNILESCIKHPKTMIINLGSSCIYPLNAENPISEDSFMKGTLEPTNSPYAMAKLTAIEIGRSLNIQHDINVVNLMPTNLYGINDYFSSEFGHVIPGLIRRMHNSIKNNEEVLKIWGNGEPLREFLYVDDLSDAIAFIIKNGVNRDLINVGSGEEISIKNLAMKIKGLLNFKGELLFDEAMPNGNPRKLLDNSYLKSIGWESKTSLDEGLKITTDWFKNNPDLVRT